MVDKILLTFLQIILHVLCIDIDAVKAAAIESS